MMKQVTAAILLNEDRVLIARKYYGDSLGYKWEFPGGKIEEGESPEECLARELGEELGIVVGVGEFFAGSVFHYEHGVIELLAYFVDWVDGEIVLNTHDEVQWVPVARLDEYDLAPADIPIKEKLKVKGLE